MIEIITDVGVVYPSHGVTMSGPFDEVNGHIIGTLMKECVRRGMLAIRQERFRFEAKSKTSHLDGTPDVFTTADLAAQKVMVGLLRGWFPRFGIVAEEQHLNVPCTHPDSDLWFTVDPLDGTKAFVRRQSHGIGCMLALVCDTTVIAACIGDVMTQEAYCFRPGNARAHRISEFGFAEELRADSEASLSEGRALIRGRVGQYSTAVQAFLAPGEVFSGLETASGSFGINYARLWKGEVAACLFTMDWTTPWDFCPVLGLCQRLEFVFLRIDGQTGDLSELHPNIDPDRIALGGEILTVHRGHVGAVIDWFREHRS